MININKKRVSILISGGGTNLQALLDSTLEETFPAEIVQVISNRPDAFGLTRAERKGVPTKVIDHTTFSSRNTFDEALHQALVASDTELVCLAGFMRLLTSDFIAKWHNRMINIHPSLLPSFPGLHTHERALQEGVRFSGCTVHFVRPKMDTGPIIIQAAVPTRDDDTPDSLAARVLEAEHQIYPQALSWVARGQTRIDGNRVIIENADDKIETTISPRTLKG